MELGPGAVAGLVIITALAAIAALVVAGMALSGQRRVQRAYRIIARGHDDDVLAIIERHIDEVVTLRNEVRDLRRRGDALRETMRGDISRIATVRYDAFDDMGGRLSFSTALLDERGDGVVITSINGRTETRTYAKAISSWSCRHHLSSEETRAIERARSRDGRSQSRARREIAADIDGAATPDGPVEPAPPAPPSQVRGPDRPARGANRRPSGGRPRPQAAPSARDTPPAEEGADDQVDADAAFRRFASPSRTDEHDS